MKKHQRPSNHTTEPGKRTAESATAFPAAKDEAVHADPLKRRAPEPQKPGERLEDYLG